MARTHLFGRRVEPLAPATEDIRVPDRVEVVIVIRVDGRRGGHRRRERDRRDGDECSAAGELHCVAVAVVSCFVSDKRVCSLSKLEE